MAVIILAKFTLKKPIIRIKSSRLLLKEILIKFQGEVWEIHLNDKDPFPSNPHAHNVDRGWKLNLSNGEIFDKSRHLRQTLSTKELKDFRNRAGKLKRPLPSLSK